MGSLMLDLALQEIVARTLPADFAPPSPWMRPVTQECVKVEAARQQLELVKLMAVLKTEGGRVGMARRNTDGSYDLGPMQVNTVNLPDLVKQFRVPASALINVLINDGCFNVAVGAWLLRERTNQAGGDFWYGIGRYHSKTPAHAYPYILRVHKSMEAIIKTTSATASAPAAAAAN
jgi:hypothetical protein